MGAETHDMQGEAENKVCSASWKVGQEILLPSQISNRQIMEKSEPDTY